jgi:hypothetical protein
MKTFLLAVIAVCVWVATAAGQVPVVINTGLTNTMYPEGVTISPVPILVPPGNINLLGATLDRTNLTDPAVFAEFEIQQLLADGVTWQLVSGAGGRGIPGGFHDRFGNPVSAITLFGNTNQVFAPGTQLRIQLTITGGSLQTSSAIQMLSIK